MLNECKTKELIFTVASKQPIVRPIIITARPIETVQSFKYLGTILTGNFDFTLNVDTGVSEASMYVLLYNCTTALYCTILHYTALYYTIL